MKFLYKQYPAKKKEVLEVTIDRSTKVKFMTAAEFKRYKNGRTHNYYGGTFDGPEVRLVVPFDSIWHVVVEKGTHQEPIQLKASCKLRAPDSSVLSTVALDAPPPKRGHKQLHAGGSSGETVAEEVNG